MLSKEWRKKNLKALGFDTVKQFQKWVLITADGVPGKTTDKWLSKVSKYAKKQLSKQKGVTAKMLLSSDKMGTGTIKAIKEYEKSQGEKKLEGRLNKADRERLGLEKVLPTKAVFSWQNRDGSINWSKVPYFKKEEFYSKNDKGSPKAHVNPYLLDMLIDMRKHFGKPVLITSGVRSKAYNNSLRGSSPTSGHRYGKAADISINGVSKNSIMQRAKKYKKYKFTYTNNDNMKYAVHVEVK